MRTFSRLNRKKAKGMPFLLFICVLVFLFAAVNAANAKQTGKARIEETFVSGGSYVGPDELPPYTGAPYAVINNNVPLFQEEDYGTKSFERYSELDSLGRCGTAFANIGRDLMPTQKRGVIGRVRPSGWQLVKYDFVDGKYLYNRCHLIGYQLSGENDNEKNLITGTRYLNVEGMLPFENKAADYVRETDGHVLYRVTPVYEGDHLVADGVRMEACSVEDRGAGVCFHVFVYNVQPGVVIDYATGDSRAAEPDDTAASANGIYTEQPEQAGRKNYVLNQNTMKFHLPGCSSVQQIKDWNRQEVTAGREELLEQGYQPCQNCRP